MTSPSTRVPPPSGTFGPVRGAGLSHVGRLRKTNEDAILTDPTGALWAVADGMGGHDNGALAADIVIDHLAMLPHGGSGEAVASALNAANAAIRARARAKGLRTMGATVAAVLVENRRALVFWAGDSRVYRLRQGCLKCVTRDHSVVQELIGSGRLTPEAARSYLQSHVVTRAVGAVDRLKLEEVTLDLRPEDKLLLCTDGLSSCVRDSEISTILGVSPEPEDVCQRLIERALQSGAPDNVSAVVIRIYAQ